LKLKPHQKNKLNELDARLAGCEDKLRLEPEPTPETSIEKLTANEARRARARKWGPWLRHLQNVCKVRPAEGGSGVPFELWRDQKRLLAMKVQCRILGVPWRHLQGKPRKKGISSAIAADNMLWAAETPNVVCITLADKQFNAYAQNDIGKFFWENLPDGIRPDVIGPKPGRQIEFAAPHSSKMLYATAGSATIGLGGTPQRIVYTEAAFYTTEDSYRATFNSLPDPTMTVETEVDVETTPNGIDKVFWPLWEQAWKPEPSEKTKSIWYTWGQKIREWAKAPATVEYVATFFSWLDELDENGKHVKSVALPEDGSFKLDDEEIEWKAGVDADPSRLGVPVTLEQMYWARLKRNSYIGDKWETFNHQYPATAALMFGATARPVYGACMKELTVMKEAARPAIWRGYIDLILTDDGPVVEKRADSSGPVHIWEDPAPEESYASGIDFSDCGGRDYWEEKYFNSKGVEVCHVFFNSGMSVKDATRQSYAIHLLYNYPYMVPERNQGKGPIGDFVQGVPDPRTLQLCPPYPWIYTYEHPDDTTGKIDKIYGFYTTGQNKDTSVATMTDLIRHGHITLRSERTIDQMMNFHYAVSKTGKRQYVMKLLDQKSRLYADDSETSARLGAAIAWEHIRRNITSKFTFSEWEM
jgi:hypothetical protein